MRFTLVVAAAPAGPAAPQTSRPTPAVSQATLLREAAEHPLVARARTLFDAAIRKVDPPRPRDPTRPPQPALTAGAVAEEAAAADDEASGGGHE